MRMVTNAHRVRPRLAIRIIHAVVADNLEITEDDVARSANLEPAVKLCARHANHGVIRGDADARVVTNDTTYQDDARPGHFGLRRKVGRARNLDDLSALTAGGAVELQVGDGRPT